MIHQRLNPDDKSKGSFGIAVNCYNTSVLLQLNDPDGGDQVRLSLSSTNIDDIVSQLLEEKKKIKRCTTCKLDLEYVMANEPWSDAHLQCPLCCGTYNTFE